jgi:hypothetical protein
MSKKEMNSVINEHNVKSYQTQMAAARFQQNNSVVSNSKQIKSCYNSPFHGGKEVEQYGKG